MIANTEWLEKSTALIRFSKEEMQNLIVALVIARDLSEKFSLIETSKNFDILRKDIVKIKNDLIKKEESYEEKSI